VRIGKCEVIESPEMLELEMPYHAGLLRMIFSVVFMAIASFMIYVLVFIRQGTFDTTLVLNIIFVLVIFLTALTMFLGSFWGQEKVTITSRLICIEHGFFGFWLSGKIYKASQIQGIFISSVFDEMPRYRGDEYENYYRGRIGFNIDKKFWGSRITIRFGSCLEQDEARQILQVIFERFPQYQRRSKRVPVNWEEK
jgi:hypothetical protein